MPSPSIVSVASRDAEPVLSSNFTMIVSASELSLLLDGVTLHQFSLLVIVHGVFAAMSNETDFAAVAATV